MRHIIDAIFTEALAGTGFSKKKNVFHLDSDETTLVISYEKSPWGNQYFITLGIYVKRLGREKYPSVNHCHVQLRIKWLSPEPQNVDNLLNFEYNGIEEEERKTEILRLIQRSAVPFLIDNSRLTALRETVQLKKVSQLAVMKSVKQLFGLTEQE